MTTNTHGGARIGAGRKRLAPDGVEKRTVSLPADMWELVKELGDGNYSAGVRRLVELSQHLPQDKA
jgi:hypothetical protein